MLRKRGIDVSYAQGNIDFDKLDKNEVSFAIVRSSYGWQDGQKDSKFDRNIRGFHSRGIPCGAYHYAYAQNSDEAVLEAKYCISCIKDTRLELPVFYDLEDSSISRLGRRTCTDIARAFCDYMHSHGWKTGIYLNPNWIENFVFSREIIGKYELWLAQWGTSKPSYKCSMWQYNVARSGSVRGIDGEVDLDYRYLEEKSSGTFHERKNTGIREPEHDKQREEKTSERRNESDDHSKEANYHEHREIPNESDHKEKSPLNQKDTDIKHDDSRTPEEHHPSEKKESDKKEKDSTDKRARRERTYSYIIRQGDTLTSIAQKYHTTVERIAEQNHIDNPDLIYAGRILRITV